MLGSGDKKDVMDLRLTKWASKEDCKKLSESLEVAEFGRSMESSCLNQSQENPLKTPNELAVTR